jgi:uncharacterized protein YecE (DUF72 family)
VGTDDVLCSFLEEIRSLGTKLGPLLLQLPPSLAYERAIAEPFFKLLRAQIPHQVVCEPRHPSWFEVEADSLLAAYAIARVAADAARVPSAGRPGGTLRLSTIVYTGRREFTIPRTTRPSFRPWRPQYAGRLLRRFGAFSTIQHRERRQRMRSRCKCSLDHS